MAWCFFFNLLWVVYCDCGDKVKNIELFEMRNLDDSQISLNSRTIGRYEIPVCTIGGRFEGGRCVGPFSRCNSVAKET